MTVSVRELVEWVVREGDIDNRRTGPAREDAMILGASLHRKIQKAAGGNYRAEVPLLFTVPVEIPGDEPLELTVEGRADGIIEDTDEEGRPVYTVDEIKGVFRSVEAMEAPENVHLAQAEVYAFILSEEKGSLPVSVQMTYAQLREDEKSGLPVLDPDDVKRFKFAYTAEEIRARFFHYIEEYAPWVRFMARHERERNASVKQLTFPYPFRPGQQKIMKQVYEAVTGGRNLFVQAPTGIGKTLAMLYPSVQSVASGQGERIFYLTAKTVAGRAAIEALRILSGKGLAFSFIQITAKEKLCPLDKAECDPVRCDRAKGHFSRVNEAIYALITSESAFSTETILEYAEKYSVCPYEFALDVSLFTDVIICDYNYVFDPHVYFRRYFAGGDTDSILLVDEAHNLVERAREMYSASLVKEHVLAGKKLFPDGKGPARKLEKLNRLLLEFKRETAGCREIEATDLASVYAAAVVAAEAVREYMDKHVSAPDQEERLALYFELADFVSVYDSFEEGYLAYADHAEDGAFFIKLFCIDPAKRLGERLDQVRSAVFFSATFLPIRYYKELLSGDPESDAIYVDSPFDPEKRRLLIVRDCSTKYTRRTAEEYERIAGHLIDMARGKKGNYLAFFPSHKFLEDVYEVLSAREDEDVEVIRQERVMKDEERKAFLARFTDRTDNDRSLLALSVMGGLFSEAIDLTGDSLIGVAVVGTGIPQVSGERELIRAYYERTARDGFDYAYRLPGFTKVLQAAGRLIRTNEDEGVILLMDERFMYHENKALFPREWANYQAADRKSIAGKIRAFWDERGKEGKNDGV